MPFVPARSRRALRLGGPLLALGLYIVADLVVAQVCKRLFPWWERPYFERTYRIPSVHYHHDLAPNVSVRAYWGDIAYPFSTNALGFRDAKPRPVSLEPKSGRVLLLGDSFTEGLGVPYEKTFAGVLGREAGKRGIEVLNAGVSSYSPLIHHFKARYYLEQVGLQFDAVLVFLDISDAFDEAQRYHLAPDGRIRSIERRTSPTDQAAQWLQYNSVTGRVVMMVALASGGYSPPPYGLGQIQARWSYDGRAFAAYGARGLEMAGQHMDSLLHLARGHGIGLTGVIYPYPDQIVRSQSENAYTEFWTKWAERNDVPIVNLFPLFIGKAPPDSVLAHYFLPLDFHWNAAGHQLVADSLLADRDIGRLFDIGRQSTAVSAGR